MPLMLKVIKYITTKDDVFIVMECGHKKRLPAGLYDENTKRLCRECPSKVKAKVTRRIDEGEAAWGFDCPDGFASFGNTDSAKIDATEASYMYNNGDTQGWAFVPIEDCPLVEEPSK